VTARGISVSPQRGPRPNRVIDDPTSDGRPPVEIQRRGPDRPDVNPVAAGIAAVAESNAHTSIKVRVDPVKDQGRTEDLNAARSGSVAGSARSAGPEDANWLCPIEDR
jgi:hypothetical protein